MVVLPSAQQTDAGGFFNIPEIPVKPPVDFNAVISCGFKINERTDDPAVTSTVKILVPVAHPCPDD